jgi:NAD(P)H dehydrogenase (quinone)
MILITGASGKTGKAIIRHLVQRGAKVRALIHHPAQQPEMIALGVADVLTGDMRQRDVIQKAIVGIETIYHICPNMCADEAQIGQMVLEVARSNGVQHFVYHSVLHPQAHLMQHHWNKLLVEEYIFTSGLPFTILQPTAYMQNIQAYWSKILSDGVYPLPYASDTRLSLINLDDVAEVAARVILEPGFDHAIFELVGTPAFSQEEIVQMIGDKIKRQVRVDTISRIAWEENARCSGMDDFTVRTLLKMFEYYETYGMGGNSGVLEWLLQHKPVTFPQYIDQILAN